MQPGSIWSFWQRKMCLAKWFGDGNTLTFFYSLEVNGSCSCFHLSFCWRCCGMWRKTTPKSFHFPGLISWSVAAKIFFLFSSLILKTWGSQAFVIFSVGLQMRAALGWFFWKVNFFVCTQRQRPKERPEFDQGKSQNKFIVPGAKIPRVYK